MNERMLKGLEAKWRDYSPLGTVISPEVCYFQTEILRA